jgi:hypothetical protein
MVDMIGKSTLLISKGLKLFASQTSFHYYGQQARCFPA